MTHDITLAVDSVITSDGRVFQFSHSSPYLAKTGRETYIHSWVGRCRKCGAPFEVTTTQRSPIMSSHTQFDLVHCKAHRLSRAEVYALGRAKLKEKRLAARRANPVKAPTKPYPGVRIGGVQAKVIDALELAGDAGIDDLLEQLAEALPRPEEGRRDRRREVVLQAVSVLRDRGVVTIEAGVIALLPGKTQSHP